MKIHQTARHWATKQALTAPVIGSIVREKLVELHTRVFLGRADPEHAEERRAHLDGFFDVTVDAYETALEEGYLEAEAREITHVQANFDFYNHGWSEMMEFPVDEVDAHFDRYRNFFEAHDVTVTDPLGEFADGALPSAPETPDRLEDPDQPFAEGGYADDTYVEDERGEVGVGDTEEPGDVDVSMAVGVEDDT